jgi:hypothetical protein
MRATLYELVTRVPVLLVGLVHFLIGLALLGVGFYLIGNAIMRMAGKHW